MTMIRNIWREIPDFVGQPVAVLFEAAKADVSKLVDLHDNFEQLVMFLTDWVEVWRADDSAYYNSCKDFMVGSMKYCLLQEKIAPVNDRKDWGKFHDHLTALYQTVMTAHKEANKSSGQLGLYDKFIPKRRR